MAGSISLSLSQQFDSLGKPLSGGLLYTYAAGTTNPQSAYQDVALTIPWPNPITLDGAGRVPPFYLADGQIKIRLTDKFGVLQVAADNLLVVGASSGTGTPPSVDATTLIQTGMLLPMYGTGLLAGFVRANGRALGNASSGASERANADTQALFQYLWTADPNLTVSSGRGASAAADYAANKTILLPDWRGRVIAGLDDMGNAAANRLTAGYFGGNGTVLGTAGGSQNTTLIVDNLPPYTPSGTVPSTSTPINIAQGNLITISPLGGGAPVKVFDTNAGTGTVASSGSLTGSAQGGLSTPTRTVPPTMLATIYIKL